MKEPLKYLFEKNEEIKALKKMKVAKVTLLQKWQP